MAARLLAIRHEFPTPEDINDSPTTAPSKRIKAVAPAYDKLLHGVAAASEIGLARMRSECPHFAEWIVFIEAWAAVPE